MDVINKYFLIISGIFVVVVHNSDKLKLFWSLSNRTRWPEKRQSCELLKREVKVKEKNVDEVTTDLVLYYFATYSHAIHKKII